MLKVRSTYDETLVYNWTKDLHINDKCEKGYQLRPHIVWFGEPVPMLGKAIEEVINSDIMIIIGTSMQVYPAASLVAYLSGGKPVFYIDPKPNISYELQRAANLKIISEPASTGVREVVDDLLENF